MKHKISTDRAYETDLEFCNNSRHAENMLRIASYRTAGNGTKQVLCIPGNNNAPRYEYRRNDPESGEYAPGYYHQSGPTLDEWELQAEYRDANDTQRDLLQF